MDLHLTVAICTWNRCSSLDETLQSFTALSAPRRATWELLVVDNNSTDRTGEVIGAFEGRLPVRRVFEKQPGQSHARNRAVAEATGDYIIWTDDDVTLSRGWLSAYVDAFRRWPNLVIFGGPIEPSFDGDPPDWLRRVYPKIAGVYAARDFGTKPIPFTPQVIPWGANFAIRAREQRAHSYNPEIGYRPGRLVSWDETEVIQALLAGGSKGRWVPDARLKHRVPKTRQTTKYLRQHFYNRGIYRGGRWDQVEPRLVFGRPRWLWRHVVEAELKYRLHRAISAPEVWVDHLATASESWGLLNGYTPRVQV